MDSFIQRQSVDLLRDNPILVRDQPIIKGDANALQWIVTVTKGGVPVDFTGATASLYCARAMLDDESGGTTWSSAATMANGTVTAVLPQDAANVAGPVGCTLRVTQNGASVTVARMAVMAIDPNGSDIVDVGNRIPNIDEVLAVVARCEEAANAANAAVSEIDNKIFSATEEKVDFDYGKNLINVNGNVKKGIYAFYSSGYCIENAEYQAIAVPVKGGKKVSFNQVFTNAHVVALSVIPDMTAVTAGDTLTGYIEGFADEARQGYVIPQKCKCLVVSIPINNASAAQCEYGEASTAYNPYVKGINASKIIGGILFVGDGYPYATIKDACDAAHDGDTIYIMPGTYKESVICYDKEVRIKGYSRDSVILTNDSGNYYASPLYIAKGAVEDLTIAETASEKDESAIAPAYCVHVDSDPQEGHSLTFKNVCFTNKVAACVGIGLRSNFKLSFQNCEFVSDEGYAVYLHESQYNGSKNQYAEFIDCIMQSNQAAHAICMQETPTVTDSEALVRFQRCIVKSASDEVITMVQYGTQPGLTGSGYLGSSVWKLDALSADNSASEMNALVFADVSKKADKVSGATDGNFAALDENGNLKDSGKNANDFAAVGEIDALKKSKAEIDDTAIDGDTWSSKHIADMLCPKVEKSGALVQMDGMLGGYPLGVKVSWTPAQEGSGDPSPENIRPIKGRTEIKVERCGENLLNIKPFDTNTKKGITFEYVPDGGIHIQGTASASVDSPTFPVGQLPPGKYYGLDMGAEIAASIVVVRNGRNMWLNTKGIFEILAGDVTKYWYAIVANGATLNNTIYPYIVPGTTAPTAYAPYIGSTNTLTLSSTVYGGEVDAEGKGQETWGCIDSYAGETLPAEWICDRAAYAAGTTPPNGAQVAYKMDKPKPFTATGGAAIPALSGTNTILTDADSVTATGRADPIQTIAKLNDRIAALEAAATNITE
nr:MAG TPA: BppU domain protein [Caudoviricetes sp.]